MAQFQSLTLLSLGGDTSYNGDVRLFNSGRMDKLIADGTDTNFKYYERIRKAGNKSIQVKVDDTYATVTAAGNFNAGQKVELTVYAEAYDVLATAEARTFDTDDIVYCYTDPQSASRSIVLVDKGRQNLSKFTVSHTRAALLILLNTVTESFDVADVEELNVTPASDVDAIDIIGTNVKTAHIFDYALALTTGSINDYGAITTKVSGYLHNGSMTTSVLTASTLLDDFSVSCDHDGLAADTLRGIRRVWSGDMPQGTADATLAIYEGDYEGTIGSGGAEGGYVKVFYADLGSSTFNGSGTFGAGFYATTVGVTNTSSDAVYGFYGIGDGNEDAVAHFTDGTQTATFADGTNAADFSGIVKFSGNGGAASANGLLMGIGTTVSPSTTAVADKSFAEFRTQSTATSGDARGIYWRHDLNGAGVSGESIRNFTKVTAAATNARGSHTSLDIDIATGSVSGIGVGVDGQLMVGDGALAGGTYAAIQAEIYSAGASTDVSGVTQIAFMRVSAGGDATGAENVDDNADFIEFSGLTAGSANMIDTDITTHTAYGGLRVNIPGVGVKYIALVSD